MSVSIAGQPVIFKGQPYLIQFVLPNFYFHVTTAYAILRHNGVDSASATSSAPCRAWAASYAKAEGRHHTVRCRPTSLRVYRILGALAFGELG